MPRRLLEQLRGSGDVYAGEHLLRRTTYDLSIWSEPSPGGHEGSPALSIEGHIDITGMGEAVVLAAAPDLTLHLEDGRRVAFSLLGTTGRIAGGLQPAP